MASMVTLDLGEALGNLNRAKGERSGRPSKTYRYITYGSPPSTPQHDRKARGLTERRSPRTSSRGQRQGEGKDRNKLRSSCKAKMIDSLTVLPANTMADSRNTTIIVKSVPVSLRRPKGPSAIEPSFTVLQETRNTTRGKKSPHLHHHLHHHHTSHNHHKSSVETAGSSPKNSARRRASKVPPPSQSQSPKMKATRRRSGSQSLGALKKSNSSPKTLNTSPSRPMSSKSSPVPPLPLSKLSKLCLSGSSQGIKSSRRRGNRASPDPFLVATSARKKGFEAHPVPAGVDDSRFRAPRSPVGLKSPKLSLTSRKGAFRYSISSHTNTPETVRMLREPEPSQQTYRRLLPYSNVKKRSEAWAAHLAKGSKSRAGP